MLLDIKSSKPLQNFYLQDLHDNKILFPLNSDFDINDGWYNLVIEWQGEEVDIQEISINGEKLGPAFYSGFFTEQDTGKHIQPCTTLYKPGYYSIWIHTEVGNLIRSLYDSIGPSDWGSCLFDKYLLTVDKPMIIEDYYAELVKSYFRHATGPKWWLKNSVNTPYEIAPQNIMQNFDHNTLLQELGKICMIERGGGKWAKSAHGKELQTNRMKFMENNQLPFCELHDIPNDYVRDFCANLGYKRILNITIQTQPPKETFDPHVDVHSEIETLPYVQGPSTFAWNLAEHRQGHYFKSTNSGLVPINDGCWFNFNYSHATVNTSDHWRPLCIIHGERDRELNYFMNV